MSNVNPNKKNVEFADNYKDFIVGTWAGRDSESDNPAMYVTFMADNTVVIDYSPKGGRKRETRYDFDNKNTIRISSYPESLVIERTGENEIHFRPDGKRLREDIDIIYICDFTRLKK